VLRIGGSEGWTRVVGGSKHRAAAEGVEEAGRRAGEVGEAPAAAAQPAADQKTVVLDDGVGQPPSAFFG